MITVQNIEIVDANTETLAYTCPAGKQAKIIWQMVDTNSTFTRYYRINTQLTAYKMGTENGITLNPTVILGPGDFISVYATDYLDVGFTVIEQDL
jgi:hypothetical protein